MIVRVEYVEPRSGLDFVVLVDDSTGEILDYPGVCWARPRKGSKP